MAARHVFSEFADVGTRALGQPRGGGLPAPLTSFLGRDEVIARVTALLDDPSVRLLTLTGPGGVGKTRLAIEVSHRIQADFADGVRFVPLGAVGHGNLIIPTIVHALNIIAQPTRPLRDTLIDVLRGQHMLLVLDNYEHLLDEPPYWLSDLIGVCPRMTVLVTSQAALHVGGEQRFEVPPLAMRDAGAVTKAELPEAMALFEQRARALKPDFAVTPDNASDVEHICREVGGLPLAIELAASRILFLGPAEIAMHLADRLRLLTGGQRDQPPRLQSMRNAIDWSHELLDPSERRLFRRLSVFVDGFTLEAAEVVCDGGNGEGYDLLGGLASLVDHSLIRRVDADHPRFVMLEVIREFGVEMLELSGEQDAVCARHAEWCISVARRVGPDPSQNSRRFVDEIGRFEQDYGNVRAALAWLDAQGRDEQVTTLAMLLRSFWYLTRRYGEALRWMRRLLETAPEPNIEVLRTAGQMGQLLGARDAARYLEEALALALDSDDVYQAAEAFFHLGIYDEDRGAYEQAEERFRAARASYDQAGNLLGLRQSDYHLGIVAYGQGRLAEAKRRFAEVIQTAEAADDPLLPHWSSLYLVLIACDERDIPAAIELLRRQASLPASPAMRHHVPDLLAAAGVVAVARGQCERAARLIGASGRSLSSLMLPERAAFEAAVATARDQIGEAAFDREVRAGCRLLDADILDELGGLFGEEPARPRTTRVRERGHADVELSPRELEVVRLLTQGMTNQAIADALYVSPRTIATHIDHVLTKLDVRSRTAAVAYAIRHGLA